MTRPAVTPPRGAEVVADAADRRVEILADHEAVNATWSRFGPGREGADLHVHRHHSDFFYVLEGQFTLRLGPHDEQVTVGPGSLVRVPPHVVHGFRNASDGELAYLNLHAPGMQFADYLRALRDGRAFAYDQHEPPEDGGRTIADIEITSGDATLTADVLTVARLRLGAGGELAAAAGSSARFLYVLEGALALGGSEAGEGAWVEAGDASATAGEAGAAVLVVDAR